MRRRADLVLLSLAMALVVPLVALTLGRGLVFAIPVLSGVVIAVFVRRTRRPIGLTLAFALVPLLLLTAHGLSRADGSTALHVASFGVFVGLELVASIGGALVGTRGRSAVAEAE